MYNIFVSKIIKLSQIQHTFWAPLNNTALIAWTSSSIKSAWKSFAKKSFSYQFHKFVMKIAHLLQIWNLWEPESSSHLLMARLTDWHYMSAIKKLCGCFWCPMPCLNFFFIVLHYQCLYYHKYLGTRESPLCIVVGSNSNMEAISLPCCIGTKW